MRETRELGASSIPTSSALFLLSPSSTLRLFDGFDTSSSVGTSFLLVPCVGARAVRTEAARTDGEMCCAALEVDRDRCNAVLTVAGVMANFVPKSLPTGCSGSGPACSSPCNSFLACQAACSFCASLTTRLQVGADSAVYHHHQDHRSTRPKI